MSEYINELHDFIVKAVKAGHEIDEIILHQHWTDALMASFGLEIDDAFVAEAMEKVWAEMRAGNTSHAKKYAYFDPAELGNSDGAMVGHYGDITGSKVITFRKDNPSKGLPSSYCDAMLRTLSEGNRLFTCEAIKPSDKRTGSFALFLALIALINRKDVIGFIVGNGSVGVSCLDFLSLPNYKVHEAFKVFNVSARNAEKNAKIVGEIEGRMKFPLVAVNDHATLPQAGFLITAASGDTPVVRTADVSKKCHILSQGRNDLEPELIEQRINDPDCIIIGDNFKAMEERDVDPLAKYHSAKGEKLSEIAKQNSGKYVEYASIITDPLVMQLLKNWHGTFLFLPVGLFAYDAAVVLKVYQALKEKLLALRE